MPEKIEGEFRTVTGTGGISDLSVIFEEVTVKEAAQICGCSRKTIQNRKKRILKTLKNIMKELGIEGGCIYFN
ncbi:MAG: RNA polymerase sigma factor [Streptococcus sp.]